MLSMYTINQKKIIYILICLGNIAISFNIAAISAVIPSIGDDLNLSDFFVSKIIPAYLIPYGIGALIYAPLTKYFSYRRIYGWAMVLFALSCYVCGLSNSINQLMTARITMGIAAACAIPLGLMIIGEFFDKEIRGRLVGGFFSCSFFASLLGVLLSGVASWRWLFFVPGVLAFILAIKFVLIPSKMLDKVHGLNINYIQSFKDKQIFRIFAFIFILSFLYHGVHKWYGVYLTQVYQMDKLKISLFYVLIVSGGALGQIIGGIISDKKSRLYACYFGIVGLGLSVVLLVGYYSAFMLAVALIAVSVFWTIGHNGLSTTLTDFPDKDRPAIASLNSSVRFISGGLGFYVSSLFVQKSFGLTFFAIGILILLLSLFIKRLVLQQSYH